MDDLTDEQRKAYALAHNKLTMNSDFDVALLDTELAEIETIDMTLLGFDDKEEETPQEVVEDDFDEEPPAEPIAKYGDLYQLGRHKLLCGDSTKIEDVQCLLGGDKCDIAFTSPPYNAGMTATEQKMNKTSKYENDDDNKSSDEYKSFLIDFTMNSLQFCEYSFVNVQSIANNKTALIDYLHDLKEYYADTIIWDKINGQPAMANNVLNSVFEYVHCFSHKHNRAIGCKGFRGTIDNIVHIGKQTKNEYSKIHNATFPMKFAEFFVGNFSQESVLDLFGGTGTTLIACEQLNRKCYMMEMSPQYVDLIIDRHRKHQGRNAQKRFNSAIKTIVPKEKVDETWQ